MNNALNLAKKDPHLFIKGNDDDDNNIRNYLNLIGKKNLSFLKIEEANKTMEEALKKPAQKKCFREFFFEGEVSLMFAESGAGKSILSVQIAEALSGGAGNLIKPEIEPGKVLYFDFELSDRQFTERYRNDEGLHQFPSNFFRVELDPDSEDYPDEYDFENQLILAIEEAVIDTEAKILIIDNITFLGTDPEKGKDALRLMKKLKKIKQKHDLTLLCLAHTPKRDQTKIITRNDLAGSRLLYNFADSVFAINESNVFDGFRYIKQLKCRNSKIIYGEKNVLVCDIRKIKSGLKFVEIETGEESDYVKQRITKELSENAKTIISIKEEDKLITDIAIAERVGVSRSYVFKVLHQYGLKKKIEKEK